MYSLLRNAAISGGIASTISNNVGIYSDEIVLVISEYPGISTKTVALNDYWT